MGGAAVRVGDSVSCGDFAAVGSGNVFVNGIPIVHEGRKTTTGHGCWPPTVFISNWSTSVFANNKVLAMKGQTKIKQHCCGKKCHDGVASSGSPNTFIES